MNAIPVVTCLLRNGGEILLLCRSEDGGSYPDRWGGVAGHVTDDEEGERSSETVARTEIREETGLGDKNIALARAGEPFPVDDPDRDSRSLVHPFLFDVETRAIETNRETSEYEWVHPPEILRRETVPELWAAYDRVRPRVATVGDDREHGSAYISVRALEVLRDEAALVAEEHSPTDHERREAAGDDWHWLATLARDLLDARPSMAVVVNRVNRAMATAADEGRTAAVLEQVARSGIERALDADEEAAMHASQTLPDRVATLSRSGTVLATLREGNPDAVLVAESRPGREGIGVAASLADDAAVTLTTDAAFPFELAEWGADCLVVGADRVLPDGRVVNKVGTRGAVVAAPENCECFVVAAMDTVAPDERVDLEERSPAEVYGGDAPLDVANPTFDVTPAGAVDGVITEDGVLDAEDITAVAARHRELAAWE